MTIRTLSMLLLIVLAAFGCAGRKADRSVRVSIVRIDTESGSGTGFFVTAPNAHRYVVTAAHVVAAGGQITVSRQVDIGTFEHYVEAYPEADVVAFDAESDLALLQLRNVPAEKMPPLALAEPVGDEEIASYGFPASSLVGRLGLTRKDGKLSNMVQLPYVDSVTRRVLKQHAVKAVIVSSALEPGFSGGPTLNARGEVVGVNVQKDDTHQAQNAAVHPSVLSALFKQLKPRSAPTTQEVAAFLSTVQSQYLQLPIAERHLVSEGSTLKLRLFDRNTPYALSLAARHQASDLTGKWTAVRSNDMYAEKLEVSIDADDNTFIRHSVHNEWSAPEGKVWSCANARTIAYDVEQAFRGKLKGGMVQAEAEPQQAQRAGAACTEACNRCTYAPDVYATFKRVGDRLVMTRSDRINNVDTVEFQRQPTWNLTSLTR